MSRSGVSVSRVVAADESTFAPLWVASRVAAGQTSDWAWRAVAAGRIREALRRQDVRIYVAAVGGEQVGFVVVTHSPLSGLSEDTAAWIDQIWVQPAHRRTGIAQELLRMVARYAEFAGANQLISCVPTQEKETNRYFARLGFTPAVTSRTTTPGALRRRLAGDEQESLPDLVVRRRRSLRARAARVGLARGTGV
ncbi:GNAT family N-acetyltransferase [Luteipulveratus sp. YIM 133132]|uniref:GNAT family N-acetyltransferase n=1 Tax=Luteipulveratus flavus TaxID=3031728 RepID=UPI0023B007FF|nr:GNAT family N-acetyltransferase [Luteipulveratus sp. YIM 133132]MDE9365998.1 GNAT family N-acetyltransferase [Luteipulveratus sp. YIM 133132]